MNILGKEIDKKTIGRGLFTLYMLNAGIHMTMVGVYEHKKNALIETKYPEYKHAVSKNAEELKEFHTYFNSLNAELTKGNEKSLDTVVKHAINMRSSHDTYQNSPAAQEVRRIQYEIRQNSEYYFYNKKIGQHAKQVFTVF